MLPDGRARINLQVPKSKRTDTHPWNLGLNQAPCLTRSLRSPKITVRQEPPNVIIRPSFGLGAQKDKNEQLENCQNKEKNAEVSMRKGKRMKLQIKIPKCKK